MFLLFKKTFLRDHKFHRFIFFGFLNTIFSISIFSITLNLGFYLSVSLFISLLAGIAFSFITMGTFVFKKLSLSVFLRFIVVCFFIYIFDFTLIKIILLFLDNAVVVQSILALPVGLLSYFLNKNFVFI